jgi:serine/threonine protein kinase
LYSVGVVFYRMLTGRLPFSGPPLTALSRIIHEPPEPPPHYRPQIEPDLEAIILKVLAKEPAQRYQSAGEFSDALANLEAKSVRRTPGAGEVETAALVKPPPLPPTESLRRARRWSSLLSAVSLAALVVAAFALTLSALLRDSSRAQRNQQPAKEEHQSNTALSQDLWREVEKGHLVRINELIARGVDVNAKDFRGETALMKAAVKGHIEIVNRLLQLSNLEANEIDHRGETALMKAAAAGQQDVVQCLLRLGGLRVAVNLKDHKGKPALTKAREANFPMIAQMIQEVGGRE